MRTPVGVLCFLPYWAARYVVPPIGGTAPAEWCLLEWCRLLAARYRHDFVPARGAGAAGNGRQEWCCGSAAPAGLRSQAGGNGASGTVPSMVPPIGGTVYGGTGNGAALLGGTVYRRAIARRRKRGGVAGPCGALRGRPGASWFRDAKASCFRPGGMVPAMAGTVSPGRHVSGKGETGSGDGEGIEIGIGGTVGKGECGGNMIDTGERLV